MLIQIPSILTLSGRFCGFGWWFGTDLHSLPCCLVTSFNSVGRDPSTKDCLSWCDSSTGGSVLFKISPVHDPGMTYQIYHAFTFRELGLSEHSCQVKALVKKYSHLPISLIDEAHPLVLISSDYPICLCRHKQIWFSWGSIISVYFSQMGTTRSRYPCRKGATVSICHYLSSLWTSTTCGRIVETGHIVVC